MKSQAETKGTASWSKTIRSYSPESNTPSARAAGSAFKLGQRFYPIMATEKQVCHLRATFRDTGGHASLAKPNDKDYLVPTAGNLRPT